MFDTNFHILVICPVTGGVEKMPIDIWRKGSVAQALPCRGCDNMSGDVRCSQCINAVDKLFQENADYKPNGPIRVIA